MAHQLSIPDCVKPKPLKWGQRSLYTDVECSCIIHTRLDSSKLAPMLGISDSTISNISGHLTPVLCWTGSCNREFTLSSFFQVLHDTSLQHVKHNRSCIEPCLRQLVSGLETLQVGNSNRTTNSVGWV